MPVLIKYAQPGISPADYEALRPIVNWEADPPPGGLFHLVWFADETIHEFDVWESEAAFEAFATQRFRPALAKAGIAADLPEVTELYNIAASEEIMRYIPSARLPGLEILATSEAHA